MKLGKEDVDLYYRLHWSLLFYVNQKCRIIEGLNEPILRQENPQKVMELYGKLFSDLGLIDSFTAENPFNFNREELDIIRSWKNFVKDRFLIVAHLKDYSVFMTTGKEQKAYGVLGLTDKIEDVVPPLMPLYLETILFPFKGRIIYCGLIHTFNIHIGSNMRRGIQAEYQQAKRKFGIITSLDITVSEKEDSEEELLKFYAKNESNRETYWEQIEAIIADNPSLKNVYHREIGSSNAKQISKRFSEIGLAPGWFAIFEDVIIASGKSENEVRVQIANILPDDKKEGAHLFRYKGGEKVGEKVGEKLTENQKKIIDFIQKEPTISAKELSKLLGISQRKIEDNLSKLKDKGLLRRIGADRGGYWEVKGNEKKRDSN